MYIHVSFPTGWLRTLTCICCTRLPPAANLWLLTSGSHLSPAWHSPGSPSNGMISTTRGHVPQPGPALQVPTQPRCSVKLPASGSWVGDAGGGEGVHGAKALLPASEDFIDQDKFSWPTFHGFFPQKDISHIQNYHCKHKLASWESHYSAIFLILLGVGMASFSRMN